jgi:hypothetical protein
VDREGLAIRGFEAVHARARPDVLTFYESMDPQFRTAILSPATAHRDGEDVGIDQEGDPFAPGEGMTAEVRGGRAVCTGLSSLEDDGSELLANKAPDVRVPDSKTPPSATKLARAEIVRRARARHEARQQSQADAAWGTMEQRFGAAQSPVHRGSMRAIVDAIQRRRQHGGPKAAHLHHHSHLHQQRHLPSQHQVHAAPLAGEKRPATDETRAETHIGAESGGCAPGTKRRLVLDDA